jgi:hypothetical protein
METESEKTPSKEVWVITRQSCLQWNLSPAMNTEAGFY